MMQTKMSLWKFTIGFRRWFLAAVLALLAGTLLAYAGPLVIRSTVDAIVAQTQDPSTGPGGPVWLRSIFPNVGLAGTLATGAVVVAVLAAGSGFFMYLKSRWVAHASEGSIRQLRDHLYDHLLHLPCMYLDQAETGDLVQRCTSDVETVRNFLTMQVVEIGRAAVLMVTVVPIMIAVDLPMALVSLAGAPVIVIFGLAFFLKIQPFFREMDESEGRMTTVLQENLTGIRVVRAFARQEHESEKFSRAAGEFRDRHFRLIRLLAVYWPLSDVLVFAQKAAVLLAGAAWTWQGRLSVGTLVAFLMFVNIYIWPLRQLGRILADLGKALVALRRMNEILDEPREGEFDRVEDQATLAGRIEFDQVTFAYADGEPVLCDISFCVEPGQTLALVGSSGAGKSTIINLLLRLYDGWSGEIRLDGRPVNEIARKCIREQVSVVMQEPFLYSRSLRENISIARQVTDDDELFEAARTAEIHEAIQSFDKGYETVVGERGVTLSGGQRQRVALARALLQKPAILILDDALSAVDTETEKLILRALRERHGLQTTIIAAHRLSTVRRADLVIVLDRGRITQAGTHESLAAEDGLYRRLWEIQGATAMSG